MTDYRILRPEVDLSEYFGEPHGWPVAAALRRNVLVGAVATHRRDDMVICGPVTVTVPGNPVFVAFRLIDCYDSYMASVGVSCYYLCLDETNSRWVNAMNKFVVRYKDIFRIDSCGGSHDGHRWYKRVLISRRSWSQKLRRIAETQQSPGGLKV